MKLILPLLLALVGAGAGIGAGLYLQPAPEASAHAEASEDGHADADSHGEPAAAHGDGHGSDSHADDSGHADDGHATDTGNTEFTKLNNQFVVPVLRDGRVKSMVVLSLSLETPIGKREVIYAKEPRIRDMFLQVLFDHANIGGFDGAFTSGDKMSVLRRELRNAGKQLLGEDIVDILVTDIARQDLG